jgi:predicted phage baseplate assembly protein
LQHRDRLVAKADFEDILQQAPGVDIGRFDVLPLVHPELDDVESPGTITIVVIPAVDPLHPNAPEPDRLFLESVCNHLEPRRLITTELHVIGPEYIPVWISVGIEVIPGEDTAPVREAVKEALRTFLSPLKGGYEEKGWPLGTAATVLQLWATAARVSGVSEVTGLLLGGDTGPARDEVKMSRLQLPRIAGIEVQVGNPVPLSDLRGEGGPPDEGGEPRIVTVPILDAEC